MGSATVRWLGLSLGLFVVGALLAPTLLDTVARGLGHLLDSRGDEPGAKREVFELFAFVGLFVASLGTSLVAAARNHKVVLAVGAAVTTLLAALAMAGVPGYFADLENLRDEAKVAATLLAHLLLTAVLVIVAVLVLLRADKLVYVVSVVAALAGATVVLGAVSVILGSLAAPREPAESRVELRGSPILGSPKAKTNMVVVVFIRPIVSAEGATTGYSSHRWTGTIDGATSCNADPCDLVVTFERGVDDSKLAGLLADRAAAVETYFITPEPATTDSSDQ